VTSSVPLDRRHRRLQPDVDAARAMLSLEEAGQRLARDTAEDPVLRLDQVTCLPSFTKAAAASSPI
jgi:hypothetical protein